MTENEIIEILQTEKACVTRAMKNECNRDCYNCDLCEEGKDILTVYDAVIKALEEREQYRAIGTVEGYERAIESSIQNYNLYKEYKAKVQEFEAIGTIEEFKALKEADMRGANRAVDEFANYLHKIAKENNGLRLSSETKSWTHPCIFDYLEEFKDEQICKEET